MRTNHGFLERHVAHASEGVRERALHLTAGDERCFAILYTPATRDPTDVGFVVCHSYGEEFQHLRRTHRAVARALARLGHPVLSFDPRGYGDSGGSLAEATLARYLEDARAAASRLADETGARRLGLVGSRFGALAALLLASEGHVDKLILVHPVFRGGDYMRHLIRQTRITQMFPTDGGPPPPTEALLDELRRNGMINVIGYPLYHRLYEEVVAVDLTGDPGNFTGDALLVHLSKGSRIPKDLEAFRRKLVERGGSCTIAMVPEPPGLIFGQSAFVSTKDPATREYVYEPVDRRIEDLLAEWASA